MYYLIVKATVSGVLIAIISEVAKRYPGLGGLIASLWLAGSPPPAAARKIPTSAF